MIWRCDCEAAYLITSIKSGTLAHSFLVSNVWTTTCANGIGFITSTLEHLGELHEETTTE